MRKMNILVCDDQREDMLQITDMLKQYEKQCGRALNLVAVTRFEEAEGFEPDLIFLDIEMPGKTGLEIRDELEKQRTGSQIIFVTGYGDAVWDAFGRNVIGFFEKPMDFERLKQLMKKFYNIHSDQNIVKVDERTYLTAGEIVWIKVENVYSKIRTAAGEDYTVRQPLSAWLSILPVEDFLRISDNCIVGCRYVETIGSKDVTLTAFQAVMPLSKRKRKDCEEKYMQYCRKMARYGG